MAEKRAGVATVAVEKENTRERHSSTTKVIQLVKDTAKAVVSALECWTCSLAQPALK